MGPLLVRPTKLTGKLSRSFVTIMFALEFVECYSVQQKVMHGNQILEGPVHNNMMILAVILPHHAIISALVGTIVLKQSVHHVVW